MLAVAIVALAIAWSPNDTILNLVGNAWAGFGAAFSPLVLFLYIGKTNTCGCDKWYDCWSSRSHYLDCRVKPLANINELFGMYEIIPGFISSVIVTYLVSIFTYKSNYSIEQQLNQVKTIVREK